MTAPTDVPDVETEISFEERFEEIAELEKPSTWEPEDLSAILDGSYKPEEPGLMPRSDGACLLYAGRVHSFHGESESGKSMIAQAEAARVLTDPAGGMVAYLDFESDASVVVSRLLSMGAPAESIRERFHYLRPDADPRGSDKDREAYGRLLSNRYALAVVDGVTEAAVVFGVTSSKDNDEITAWIRTFTRRIAQRTGAAVIQVDHVTKDSDTRGRFAIGAGAKMAALDGAAYVVEVKEPLGVGMRGVVVMRVAKDRPGRVRPRCGKWRASDRTQEAARIIVDSTEDGRIDVRVEPPSPDSSPSSSQGGEGGKFRPTVLMERVSAFLATQSEPPSQQAIVQGVKGKESALTAAIARLAEEGYIDRYREGNSWRHRHVRPYREAEDPASDRYAGSRAEINSGADPSSREQNVQVRHIGLLPGRGPTPPSSRGYTPGREEEEIRPPLPPPGAEKGGDRAEREENDTHQPACTECHFPITDPTHIRLCEAGPPLATQNP